jgi:hypothetical protein
MSILYELYFITDLSLYIIPGTVHEGLLSQIGVIDTTMLQGSLEKLRNLEAVGDVYITVNLRPVEFVVRMGKIEMFIGGWFKGRCWTCRNHLFCPQEQLHFKTSR